MADVTCVRCAMCDGLRVRWSAVVKKERKNAIQNKRTAVCMYIPVLRYMGKCTEVGQLYLYISGTLYTVCHGIRDVPRQTFGYWKDKRSNRIHIGISVHYDLEPDEM